MTKKTVYPIEIQQEIIHEAKDLVLSRYANDPTVLAIYLGGSALKDQLGVYDAPTHQEYAGRSASDIDIILVIRDRYDWLPLPEQDQHRYGVRHIGHTKDVPIYRLVDEQGRDVFLHGLHPIEPLIFTKDFFEGVLAGKYPWGRDKPRNFSDEVKKFEALKESEDLKQIREKYCSYQSAKSV